MALIDEPGPHALPNVSPLDYERTHCRDAHGVGGIAYYAVRQVNAGEPLLVCFGAEEASSRVQRNTSCSTHPDLLDRWSRLQRTMLAPYLRAW